MIVKRVFLLGHTHHDVGYTASPRIVDLAHRDIVGRVVELAAASPDAGPAAFRWTFEAARPVLGWLERASDGERARFLELARSGRVAATGGYLNLTQLPGESEFRTLYDTVSRLRGFGLEVRTEQHGDVNGIAWGAADLMLDAGLTRLVMALNPDHGRPPLAQPSAFWWAAPSGRRVFTLLSTHYGYGEEWGLVDGDCALAARQIEAFVAGLEARDDYPFDCAVVHAGNDNRWPTARFLAVVDYWNARHPECPMATATIDQVLDRFEAQAAAAALPELRGEWSDWWSHGHGSSAREVAVYREARSFLAQAEAELELERRAGPAPVETAEVIGYRRGPYRLKAEAEWEAARARIDEFLALFAEHTWGSWETYSAPESNLSRSSWNAKAAFAYAAWDEARQLAVEAFARAVAGASRPQGPVIAVVNPSSHARRETIAVETATHERRRLAVDVAAGGVAFYPVPAAAVPTPGDTLRFGPWSVRFDAAAGGIASLLHCGRELVAPAAGAGLGAIVAEVIDEPGHPFLADPKRFRPEDPGPRFRRETARASNPRTETGDGWAALAWDARFEAAGDPLAAWPGDWATPPPLAATIRLTLTAGSDLATLEADIAKPARLAPESVHLLFPFALAKTQFLLETAGAVYQAGAEQLPDTALDWFSIQEAAGLTDGQAGVLWGTLDAPLVQLGGLHTGEWARQLDASIGLVSSWLMNNLHFTNFQASQPGSGRYRYRFQPAGGVQKADVRQFGDDCRLPLAARTLAQLPA